MHSIAWTALPVAAILTGALAAVVRAEPAQGAAERREADPPRVLLLGDSISIGYTPFVQQALRGKATVLRPLDAGGKAENCSHTGAGVASIDRWLGTGQWAVVHFNFGLHDLKHMDKAAGKTSASPEAPVMTDLAAYEANLEAIVTRLERTGAALVFATTTPVPEDNAQSPICRLPADVPRYNEAALRVMARHGVAVDDLYAFALPRLKELQRPRNVHFTEPGSAALGGEVVKAIEAALARPGGD